MGGIAGGGLGAAQGGIGAGLSSLAAGKLNALSQQIADKKPTGNADADQALGNILANTLATTLGAVTGGATGALTAHSVDRYNRQLHPDERQWAKAQAKDFAKFYSDKTGQALTAAQAENMLLANGYRLVDAAASKGPGGDAAAIAFISQHGGQLFTATSKEYNDPKLNGNLDGSLTPEQRALPGSTAHPVAGLAVAAGVVTAGLAPEIAAAAAAAFKACAVNPVLCANHAGIAAGEIAAAGAMPAGTGASVAVKALVSARGEIGGVVFNDVNQTARASTAANEEKLTLIADRVAQKSAISGKALPNGNMADAHAEIGVIQQAYDAGKTVQADMSMTVHGKDVCGYCKGDIAAAAEKSGLKSLTVHAVDDKTNLPKTYVWEPGMKTLKVRN